MTRTPTTEPRQACLHAWSASAVSYHDMAAGDMSLRPDLVLAPLSLCYSYFGVFWATWAPLCKAYEGGICVLHDPFPTTMSTDRTTAQVNWDYRGDLVWRPGSAGEVRDVTHRPHITLWRQNENFGRVTARTQLQSRPGKAMIGRKRLMTVQCLPQKRMLL